MSDEEAAPLPQAQLIFNIPEEAMGHYATNMLVQRSEHEYILTFFEAKAPVILDPSQPFPTQVRADYVCRIIVAAGRMPDFVEVLQRSLVPQRPSLIAKE